MVTLPYPRKEFTVTNNQSSCRVIQHFEDERPRTICTFEKHCDIDYERLAQLVADELNKTSTW